MPEKRGILFEIKKIGTIQRVCAIDPQTGTEAIIQAPASLSLPEAQKLAAQKLAYILKKKDGSTF